MNKIVLIISLFFFQTVFAQILKPEFDKSEYIELLKINQKTHIPLDKWKEDVAIPLPEDFEFVYRSPVVAFDNIWDLWIHKKQRVAVVSIQGSIATEASFLANFYAAMIPAKGTIQLDNDFLFNYTLAENPNAAVHVGWFISMAYLSSTIETKIDSCYKSGIRDFIITGHSQGGGIAFLLTAYLENLKKQHKLPEDIQFKTYCSAGPKPGNLFFAYAYENMTSEGWAYNVVNTADWVPDVPFSVQTVNDFTDTNPFRGAKKMIKKQKFPKNIALQYAYNQLSKPSLKAQKNYEKYLGKMVSQMVKKQIPSFNAPKYYKSNYYVRTGNTIVLFANDEYFNLYENDPETTEIWRHHLIAPYLFLANKLK